MHFQCIQIISLSICVSNLPAYLSILSEWLKKVRFEILHERHSQKCCKYQQFIIMNVLLSFHFIRELFLLSIFNTIYINLCH